MRNAVNGYTYHGRTPIVEWENLLRAKSWRFRQCRVDGSEQHALYQRYLEAVEEEVDYLIRQNREVSEGGVEPWEYLCQFFERGVAPLSKSKAKKVAMHDYTTSNYLSNILHSSWLQSMSTSSILSTTSVQCGREDRQHSGDLQTCGCCPNIVMIQTEYFL